MPRGKPPKQTIAIRVAPELVAEFRSLAPKGNFSAAIDEGIRWWIARERRLQKVGKTGVKPPKGRPLSPRGAADRAFAKALLDSVASRSDEERAALDRQDD